ncbi:hypothetical protein QJQ45_024823 [Haematococcus lacustris]|nr:hypothetical protein QJQ45_024823 [Haematococcus lacustris]
MPATGPDAWRMHACLQQRSPFLSKKEMVRHLSLGSYQLLFTSRLNNVGPSDAPATQSVKAIVRLSSRAVVKLETSGRRHAGVLSLQLHDLRDNSPCDLWTWRRQQEGQRIVETKLQNDDSVTANGDVTANGVTLNLVTVGRKHSSGATLTEMEEADVEQLCQKYAEWSEHRGCYLPPMDLSSVEDQVEAGEGKEPREEEKWWEVGLEEFLKVEA